MTRCFLGFELTDEGRAHLEERVPPFHARLAKAEGWDVRLVLPENWHATLLFFQDLSGGERELVWAAVEEAVGGGAWIAMGFPWQGLALWPNPRRPNLICLEAPAHPPARDWPIQKLLGNAPFDKGEVHHLQSYRPHITLMRFRRGREGRSPRAIAREWAALGAEIPSIDPECIRFDRISFFLSTLSRQQPVYPRERTLALGIKPWENDK